MDFTGKGRALYFFSLILGVYGAYVYPTPQNTVAINGAPRVFINCTSSPNGAAAIGWGFLPVGSTTSQQISNGYTVFSSFVGSYELEQPTGTMQNNLIIKVADESTAGTYSCSDAGASPLTAELTVSSNPTCSYNAPNPLFQSQTVQMSCSITYTAHSFVNASMQWSSGGSSVSSSISYSSSGNQTIANSTTSQQAGYSNPFPMYNCTTTFKMSSSLPNGAATNQPNYTNTSSPFSTRIPVNYLNPSTIKITGAGDGSVNIGANATCWVDANPPANYTWYNGSTTTNGPSIKINVAGDYNCTASNIAGSTSKSINVTDVLTTTSTSTVPTTTSTTTITNQASNSSGGGGGLTDGQKIGIGVGVGVGGAILIALIAVLVWYCCFKSKGKTGSKYTKDDRNDLNLKPVKEPPPYSGQVGPQRQSHPDVVDYAGSEYSHAGYPNQRPMFGDEGLNYAQIQLDNNPRSRMPLQVPENGNYADVRLA